MASKMHDALSCFTFLVENAPAWINSLEEVDSKIKKKEVELATVSVPVVQKIKKTSSSESIRPSGEDTSSPSTGMEIMSAPQAFDVQQAMQNGSPIAASRKRKTLSLVSAASGMHKHRSRHHITVYYDSHVQDIFDRLVRNISSARGNIRKSKMADKAAIFANMDEGEDGYTPERSSPSFLRSISSATGTPPMFNSYQPRHLRSSLHTESVKHMGVKSTANGRTSVVPLDARDQVDTALGKAQDFCEHGAHQFLRDGDCSEEVMSAKAAFENVLQISQNERQRLQKADSERNKLQQQSKPEEHSSTLSNEHAGVMRTNLKNEMSCSYKGNTKENSSFSDHPALMLDSTIEVEIDDESSEGEDDFVPSTLPSPPFRLMART